MMILIQNKVVSDSKMIKIAMRVYSLACSNSLVLTPFQARRQGGFEGFARTPLLAPKRFYIHCYSTF